MSTNKKFCLSPLAGYTDPAFRYLCGLYGAEFTTTEMVSADGLIRGKQEETMKIIQGSPPTAIQLFGSDKKIILDAAKLVEHSQFTEININAGCPVRKVISNGKGGALLKNIKNFESIIKYLHKNLYKQLSVKIRSGYDSTKNLTSIVKMIEKTGVNRIILHARTISQGYSGKADWNLIKKVRELCRSETLIYGNGDIKSWEDAYKMIEDSGCDGVYIGRAAMANPLIFKEIKKKKSVKYTKTLAKKWFLEYYKIRKENNLYSTSLKAIAIGACKSFEGAKELRVKILSSKNDNELVSYFKEF